MRITGNAGGFEQRHKAARVSAAEGRRRAPPAGRRDGLNQGAFVFLSVGQQAAALPTDIAKASSVCPDSSPAASMLPLAPQPSRRGGTRSAPWSHRNRPLLRVRCRPGRPTQLPLPTPDGCPRMPPCYRKSITHRAARQEVKGPGQVHRHRGRLAAPALGGSGTGLGMHHNWTAARSSAMYPPARCMRVFSATARAGRRGGWEGRQR